MRDSSKKEVLAAEATLPKALNLEQVKAEIGYPLAAQEKAIQGQVLVRVLVDENGSPIDHAISQRRHIILHEAILSRLYTLRFSPALQLGVPTKAWVELPFEFGLDQPVPQANKQLQLQVKLYFKKGMRKFEKQNYTSAVQSFSQVCDITGNHLGAAIMLDLSRFYQKGIREDLAMENSYEVCRNLLAKELPYFPYEGEIRQSLSFLMAATDFAQTDISRKKMAFLIQAIGTNLPEPEDYKEDR